MRHMLACVVSTCFSLQLAALDVPAIDGDWWKIGEQNPDLGQWSTEHGDACDFTVFRAADGAWQLIACVRNCAWPSGQRIFHRWEARDLEDRNWTPKGVFLTPDAELNQLGAIQAPHLVVEGGTWRLFYNATTGFGQPTPRGNAAYVMESADGRAFAHRRAPSGQPWHFAMGRDLMLLRDDAGWLVYYTGRTTTGGVQDRSPDTMVVRRSPGLDGPWGDASALGVSGNPESPFVVKRNGVYYLWQQLRVFASDRPDRFDAPAVAELTPGWKYAPEIIEHDGRWYMAAYSKGLWMCRLRWDTRSHDEIAAWQRSELPRILEAEAERLRRHEERMRSQK